MHDAAQVISAPAGRYQLQLAAAPTTATQATLGMHDAAQVSSAPAGRYQLQLAMWASLCALASVISYVRPSVEISAWCVHTHSCFNHHPTHYHCKSNRPLSDMSGWLIKDLF
jgi:hypothetical protein